MQIVNAKRLKVIRSNLRRNMPAPELVLWQRLRGKGIGYKFRRQYSIGNSVLDFYSHDLRMAIEIEGDSNDLDQAARAKDAKRDSVLEKIGVRVLRFTNRDVMDNIEGVIDKILESTPS